MSRTETNPSSKMLITNARVLLPDGEIANRSVLIEDGVIAAVRLPGMTTGIAEGHVVDLEGKYLVPGFIDTHVHGALGFNLMAGDDEATRRCSTSLATKGVTTFVAGTASVNFAQVLDSLKAMSEQTNKQYGGARYEGIHLEGPFISASHRGVHPEENLVLPTPEAIAQVLSAAGGALRICTLAPELPGGLEAIRALSRAGVKVSIGHTGATYSETVAAIGAGAVRGTHLFNAMPPLHHRNPGPIPALLAAEQVMLEIVGDSLHVDLELLAVLFSTPGLWNRLMLVSDGTDVSGLPDGRYRRWEGTEVQMKDGRAFTLSGGVAGSTGSLVASVKNLVDVGVPLERALAAASTNPARSLGLFDRGEIRVGYCADFAVLTPALDVDATLVGGEFVFEQPDNR